tara:strand:- start:1190 stop:1990 length:801 start_codon:yes stop_codon:yes gene_type:complete
MFEIAINHKSGRKAYPVYTEKEAIDSDIEFKHWKKAKEGQYCISDDGYVSIVLKRKEYESDRNQPTLYIRTPYGYIMHNPNYTSQKFYAEGRSTPWTLSGKPALEVQSRSQKWKNLALAYVSTNFDADLAIDMVMGQTTPQQRRRWKRNIRTEEFKTVVREELDVLLKESGKDKEYVMDLLEEAIAMAKKKEDVSNLMRATEKLMSLHGMDDKETIKTTRQIEGVSTKKLIADVLEEEQKLKLTETTEGNGELRGSVSETSSTKEV